MEHSEATKLFSTKEHLCADYHVFMDSNDPALEIEYAMRESHDDDEEVGEVPLVSYNKRTDEFFYGYDIYIDGDCVDTIGDQEEFTREEVDYLERVIRENFDNL